MHADGSDRSVFASKVADLWSRVRLISRRLGWAHVLLWSLSAVGRRLSFHTLVVWLHPFDDRVPEVTAHTSSIEARFLNPHEILSFASDENYHYTHAFASNALARGYRCFGLLERGRLLSYCWYATGPAPVFDDVEVSVDFPFIYGFNAYTDASQRGRGLHVFGVHAGAQALKREGFRGISAYIEADNLAPLVAARKMGERVVGYVFLWRLFGKFRWVMTSGCGEVGFRVSHQTPLREKSPTGRGGAPKNTHPVDISQMPEKR